MTDAVFHAPMFALNADANKEPNACAPKPHAVHADGQGLARSRVSGFQAEPAARARQRVRTQPIHHPSHTSARIHNAGRFSHIQINGYCMYQRVKHRRTHVYIFACMYRTSPPRGRTYTHGPAQASADKCAQRARASAVPPRTTGLDASKPGRARPP